MAAKVICILQQKGGVGKTTTASTLAHGLARAGHNTLLLDLDPQGQLAPLLGLERSKNAYRFIISDPNDGRDIRELPQLIESTGRERLWIITGNEKTADGQIIINNPRDPQPISHFWSLLRPLTRTDLGYIVIDTSPSVGGIQERIAWAADLIVVPVATEFASLNALQNTYGLIRTLTSIHKWKGKLAGFLPTFYDDTTRESQTALDNLKDFFPGLVFEPIHRATIVRECWRRKQTLFEIDPKCRPALEYQVLADEMMRR